MPDHAKFQDLSNSKLSSGNEVASLSHDSFNPVTCSFDPEHHVTDDLSPIFPSLSSINQHWPQFHAMEAAGATTSCQDKMGLPPLSSVFTRLPATDATEWSGYSFNNLLDNVSCGVPQFSDHQHLLGYKDLNQTNPTPITANENINIKLPSVITDCYQHPENDPYTLDVKDHAHNPKSRITKKRFLHFKDKGKAPPNVNVAFKKLRNLIPTEPVDRRLSKVETLRLAVSYIQHLGQTLNSDEWIEQPCLSVKVAKESDRTSSICTFCMSNKRKLCSKTY